ncbi:DUF3108 domain-containing protein [Thermospira aquatica]|uniref:DUF3108 domain-containing protein n=2 Tax=Thermospira aquatica TaxID=2828656 RepID=A0AAX3BBJ5_9SPIR|nr:DUF3108 domain-containing protein [Thermospira aquatica]URA09688.1 hypothetical protein KDW03_09390 [Thermospira aquatica]
MKRMFVMKRKAFFVLFLVFGLSYGEAKILSSLPMKYGERLSFRIYILGQYVGNHFMQINRQTNIAGVIYPIVAGRTLTREDLRHLYDMDDRDWTIFDKRTLFPLYNERIVKEGKWEDFLKQEFVASERACYYYHRTRNYERNEMKGKLPIMDYNTLILYFRSLDYDRMSVDQEIPVSYKHRDTLYETTFTSRKITVTYKKNKVPAIQVREKGGLGIYFTMLDDENRTPYEIRIAAFYIVGFRFVDLRVAIENFQPGTTSL